MALMYDEDDSDPANATEAVLADLNYAYQRYISRCVADSQFSVPALRRPAGDFYLSQRRQHRLEPRAAGGKYAGMNGRC